MSEIINVTVLRDNNTENYDVKNFNEENGDDRNKDGGQQEIGVMHDINMTLMSTLLRENLISEAFCGGRGSCGRCRIQFSGEAPMPAEADRRTFTPDELREGYRLACMSRPKKDCVIRLNMVELNDMQQIEILTTAPHTAIADNDVITDNYKDKGYMIAVDLGTTTIAMQLTEMSSGKVADTYCTMNPQRSYGADVLSRIQAADSGHGRNLRDSVWKVLQDGVDRFCDTINKEKQKSEFKTLRYDGRCAAADEAGEICCMCVAGNTTMEHLLMGLSTKSLGRSPFTPVEIGLQKCTMSYNGSVGTGDGRRGVEADDEKSELQVYITPGISAFVGGDIVAGLYHCGLLDSLRLDRPQDSRDAVLFIDLGTNGEMALTDGSRMIVTAASAGPAFEGGANASVPGSDMIAIMAFLLKQGIIDETGLLKEEYFEQGIDVPLSNIKGPEQTVIHLTQKDIRDVQMAKAAVRAGMEILYERMGRPGLTHVYLAGGFGYYLDVNAAITVGLLPEHMRHIVTAAGNTSLAGAFDMGRDLRTGRLKEETLDKQLNGIESLNLAEQPNFEALYLSFLNFPTAEA